MPAARSRLLTLDQYRALVSLDEPFSSPKPASKEEHPRLLKLLRDHLGSDRTERKLRREIDDSSALEADPRAWLRALLTVRGPEPLPDAIQQGMDQLLQAERRTRDEVDPFSLPRIDKDPGSIASRCAVWQGDITTLAADAVVNAANSELLGCFRPFHACIDNAIHAAAGPRLREDCARLMEAQGTSEPTGHAKATRAYNLPSRYVLHTVGPIVRGAVRPEDEKALASCYVSCLDLAVQLRGVRSVAFCSISTGVFGFPKGPAARVALQTVASWFREHPNALELVIFNVFGDEDRAAYATAVGAGALELGS
ncbi:MAG: protein-ADP-ribose hydrolase [Myxococcaceae bacterium]